MASPRVWCTPLLLASSCPWSYHESETVFLKNCHVTPCREGDRESELGGVPLCSFRTHGAGRARVLWRAWRLCRSRAGRVQITAGGNAPREGGRDACSDARFGRGAHSTVYGLRSYGTGNRPSGFAAGGGTAGLGQYGEKRPVFNAANGNFLGAGFHDACSHASFLFVGFLGVGGRAGKNVFKTPGDCFYLPVLFYLRKRGKTEQKNGAPRHVLAEA